MEYQAPKSQCELCLSEFAGRGMTRHMKTCLVKHFQKKGSKATPSKLLYIHVYDPSNPDYFLHLLVSGKTSFGDLDLFLRNIWLECCGHMSAFSYRRYEDEIDMRKKVGDVLMPGVELIYQYDFGSTTELSVRGIDIHHGAIKGRKNIQILARNSQPLVPCDGCGQRPATVICTECQWGPGGWLCDACAANHPCDEDMLLPVVNSPRTGVCGYAGDD